MATALPLPDRPSIAVLPFVDPSDEFDAQAFADGVSEHITDALACTRGLFVTARNSAFTFKGQAVEPRGVARRLGVEHILEGTIRRANARLEIRARLHRIDAEAPVWSQDFEDHERAIHEIRGRIVAASVAMIAPALRYEAAGFERTRSTVEFAAYAQFLSAYANYAMPSHESVRSLMTSIEGIRRLMPGQPLPDALIAQCYTNLVTQGWSEDIPADCAAGARFARAALDRADDDPTVLMMVGHTLAFLAQDHDAALALLDRSLALNPNASGAYERAGWVRCYAGQAEVAEAHFRAAKRQSPLDITTFRFDSGLGLALCMQGKHEEAVHWLKRSMNEDPFWTSTHRVLAASFAHLGRHEEAQATGRRFMELEPSYRIGRAQRLYCPSEGRDRFIEGMRLAGLPE